MLYSEALRLLSGEAPDFSDSLRRIETFLNGWWKVPYLPWFTDHGPDHSRRVMEYLLAIIPDGLTAENRLTAIEIYVACAAALTHDLGMQVLIERQSKLGELTAADFDAVRAEHPKQSLEVIINNASEIGIPNDPELISAVALVAQAHGTKFFSDSIAKLTRLESIRNKPFRGALLGALILMADELDLHYERALKPDPKQATLNTISRAHYYKHHYITRVHFERSSIGELQIELDMTFPLSVEQSHRDAIYRWVTTKLQTQIGLVQPYILEGLKGGLRFSRAIRVHTKDEEVPLRSPIDLDALRVIETDNLETAIIDYRQQRRLLIEALNSQRVVGVLGMPGDDPDGREDVLDWVRVKLADSRRVVSSERLRNVRGGSATDVLTEWLSVLGKEPIRSSAELQKKKRGLDTLIECGDDMETAFTVSSIDNLLESDQDWILTRCLPQLLTAFPNSMVAFSGNFETPSSEGTYMVRLGTPEPTEVTQFFRRFEDNPQGQIYLQAGIRYGTLKKLACAHELALAEDTQ